MNLTKLFEMQKKLDERIVREKGLEGQDLLPKKILALQVELGELCQEWRGFKFWSNDQKARGQAEYLEYRCKCEGGNRWVSKNPLLEEYVDCLHFILSIGLEIDTDVHSGQYTGPDITKQFNFVFRDVSALCEAIIEDWSETEIVVNYNELVLGFIGLGEMLGFTWDQIEQAYLDKNKVNHERQENGY